MNRVAQAFETIDRADFLPADRAADAPVDAPIPIGHGQTNSQPSTVRMMLEWLDCQSGDRVLDLGSGSGWTMALLAAIVGTDGRVVGVERIPELVAAGRDNLAKYRFPHVRIEPAGPETGWPKEAPYDRILVSAAASRLPEALVAQLKPGGRMVVPVGSEIQVIDKTAESGTKILSHPGFAFVPLVDD